MRFFLTLILFTSLLCSAGATEHLPCVLTSREHSVSENLRVVRCGAFHGPDGVRADISDSSSFLSSVTLDVRRQSGGLALAATMGNSLVQSSVAADSLFHAVWNGSAWNVYLVRGDSLLGLTIGSGGASSLHFIRTLVDVRASRRHNNGIVILSSDSIFITKSTATDRSPQLVAVSTFPRFVLNAVPINEGNADRDFQVIVISSLAEDACSVERYRNSNVGTPTWETVGTVPVFHGLVDASRSQVVSLSKNDMRYRLTILSLVSRQVQNIDLPDDLTHPLALHVQSDTVVVVCQQNVFVFKAGALIARSPALYDETPWNLSAHFHNGILLIDDAYVHDVFSLEGDSWYALRSAIDLITLYAPWIFVIILISILGYRALSYRQLALDVLEHSTRGVSFVVDRNSRLRRVNAQGRDLLSMDAGTPLRNMLSYYCHTDVHMELSLIHI